MCIRSIPIHDRNTCITNTVLSHVITCSSTLLREILLHGRVTCGDPMLGVMIRYVWLIRWTMILHKEKERENESRRKKEKGEKRNGKGKIM